MTPNCKYNLTNANYRKVIQEVKQSLGSDYNYDIFRSVADTFEGDINSLTSEYVLQRYPRKNAPQEKISQESLQSASSSELPLTEDQAEEERIKAAKDEAKKQEIIAARWARSADGMESFEVSSAGDEFGKKFSALNAVLAEGTVFKMKIKKGRKTIEQTFDVGGYSVEAAYQMVKGYDRNPKGSLINKDGKPMKINGKGKAPISDVLKVNMGRGTAAERRALEEYTYMRAYLPLWKLWAGQNKDLIKELKKKAKNKILTDKFARTRISQARALSEIMWGAPKTPVSETVQNRYDIERKNAIAASREVASAVRKIKKQDGVRLTDKVGQQIIYYVEGRNAQGVQTPDSAKILSFTPEGITVPEEHRLLLNPFEGEKDAVKKFIQWIIPNDFDSLPDELRKNSKQRNDLRMYLAKGGYQNKEIIMDGSSKDKQRRDENILYAKTLRYIIDNFQELRQKYNPLDIQEFGNVRHKVFVTMDSTARDDGGTAMLFAPQETVKEGETLNSIDSFELESSGKGEYILSFPADYNTKFSKTQKERLYKTIAMAVPEGSTITINPAIATNELIADFKEVVQRGFTQVGDKTVTMNDGSEGSAGIYRRNEFRKQAVITKDPYTFEQAVSMRKEDEVYLYETNWSFADSESAQNALPFIPIITSHNRDYHKDSYFNDSQFELFKKAVDSSINKAKMLIDQGYKVVLPKGVIGSGQAALQHYAPKCFQYLQEQLYGLREYGNSYFLDNEYLKSRTPSVDVVDKSPSEGVNLNVEALQSPRARLRQRYSDDQIQDLIGYYTKDFLRAVKLRQKNILKELKKQIANTKDSDAIDKLQLRINALEDPNKWQLSVIREVGEDALLNDMEDTLRKVHIPTFKLTGRTEEQIKRITDSFDMGFRDIIFEYSWPTIEERSGIRITSRGNMGLSQTEKAENDNIEDVEGEDTPEMGFSYNHRLVDPYKSRSKEIRKILSSIPMRDPNDRRRFLRDSIGEVKHWDDEYIYSCIMSRMAQMGFGEVDNFMVITPREKLSDEDKAKYPYGKPSFPILDSKEMKARYSWASDLVDKLTYYYRPISVKETNHSDMSTSDIVDNEINMSTLGNVVSQFYTNFCQQYVPYCTMVNGDIILENEATGAASLKQSATANYEGNIRFKGIDMVYDNDGSVNNENVQKALDKLKSVHDRVMRNGRNDPDWSSDRYLQNDSFWKAVESLQNDYENFNDAFNAAPSEVKDVVRDVVDILKSCGIVFSDYDIFCVVFENKNPGFTEMLNELQLSIESLKGLPAGEHIFLSSYSLERSNQKNKTERTPQFYWNKFFEKFGDYVTEREYESSKRILGKSRYSYVFPSYMSNTLKNLTNPDLEARRKYIRENFMPYEWFYDKATGTFKNTILNLCYNNTVGYDRANRMIFGIGHDLICKKDGNIEKDYADWTPDDIYQLMFRELSQPTHKEAGCFISPVLSDSRICKAIQMPKYSLPHQDCKPIMRGVILQELERMKLVEKRNIILRMQDLEEKMSSEGLNSDDRAYYDSNLEFYQKYKEAHPEKLQEIDNFDKNGSKFCFFPELNGDDYNISIDRAKREGNDFMERIVRLLSQDYNNPSNRSIGLKRVLEALQSMSDERFDSLVNTLGLTKTVSRWMKTGRMVQEVERVYDPKQKKNVTVPKVDEEGNPVYAEATDLVDVQESMTKEDCINRLIEDSIDKLMKEKIDDFYYGENNYKRGSLKNVNQAVFNAVLKADKNLMAWYNKLPVESENNILTKEQTKEVENFYNAVYHKVRDFYWAHTANMSQFLQIMVTDIAYYKDPTKFAGSVDFAKRFKEVYGAGMKLNTNSKFGKKIERSIILKDRIRRSHSFGTLRSVLQNAVDEGRIIKEEAEAVLDKFKFINGVDAQAMRSLTSYRDVMDMIGEYNEDLARAIDNLRNNRWTMNDFYTVVNTLKPFSFGPEEQDSGIDDIKLRTMVQHKNSEMVLLAVYNTLVGSAKNDVNYSARLRGINRAMEDIVLKDDSGNVMKYTNGEEMRAIDLVQYQSAVKVGAHGVVDINYSRDKLKKAMGREEYMNDGYYKFYNFSNEKAEKELENWIKANPNASYYKIESKLGDMLDSEAISDKEYEAAMDFFEPDEEEVFEIIRSSIYKNGDESLGYDNQVLHKLPYSYYSIQQPTPDHYTDNDKATFGSQPRHHIMADIPDDFSITINGNKYNREGLRERYNGLLVANLIDCYVNEIEPLFASSPNDKRPAIYRLQERLFRIIEGNPKYGRNMKDALQIVDDGNGGKTFALPVNNITISTQLEEIMTSMFKNAIHRQTINGGNVILAADVGYSNSLKVLGKRDSKGKLTSVEGIECFLPAHMQAMFEPYLEIKKDAAGNAVLDNNGNPVKILDPEKLKENGLDKAIGYRIPTEGLYSIMPLVIKGFLPQQSGSSIVVAQEITTLTGSDNDVDKLFLMMKATKGQKAISTPKGKEIHPLDMSKEQRDNEIIDIFYGVTTHPKMAHRFLHPGHFDNITLNSLRLRILKDRNLRKKFRDNCRFDNMGQLVTALTRELTQEQYNEMYCRAMQIPREELKGDKSLLDIVEDFTNTFQKPLSPVYPSTFVTMHQEYMAGVAEKGIFANNGLDHAKLQWANLEITPDRTFVFEGREVRKIDPRTVTVKKGGKEYQHYITDDCAECSAAAVDNGKKPVLAGLNSNKQTATFFGFLTRLGLGIEGAGLLLAQPQVDWNIKTYGVVDSHKSLEREIKKLGNWLKEHHFDLNDDSLNWRTHNFTMRELYDNLLIENYTELFTKGATDYAVERISSLYRVYNLILNLKEINNEMGDPRTALHFDSPNHAASTSMGGVVLQTKAVEDLNRRKDRLSFNRALEGDDQLVVYDVEKKYNSKKAQPERHKLFDALMSTELPITQAFYTLGIEKVRTQFAPYFSFGREEIQDLTDRLCDLMDRRYIRRDEDRVSIISQMYKDWVVYNLSRTELFGDDSEMTYDQKRQYYLYQYPAIFLREKENIPELNQIDGIRRMSVRDGLIVLDRGGKTSMTLRDFITDSFDSLIQHTNPDVQKVAKDLFMYSYYLNGGDYSYMSFGNFMSTEFQRAFPEYIQALRDMSTNPVTEEDLDNFFEQFLIKRGSDKRLLNQITYKNSNKKAEGLQRGYHDTGDKVENYGGINNVDEYVYDVSISGGNTHNELLRLNKHLTELYGTIIYEPVQTNTSLHFNASQTADEILDTVYEQDLIDMNRRLGRRKKGKGYIFYDSYQASKRQTEASTDRDANTSEPLSNGTPNISASSLSDANPQDALAISSATLEDNTSVDMDYSDLEKAVGNSALDDVDPVEEADAFLQGSTRAIDSISRDEDKDINEAQKIIEENNNGKGLCD